MEQHEQNIDDLFRDALDDYTESPPPAVWKDLQGRLTGKPSPWIGRRIVWLSLAVLLLIGIPTITFISYKNTDSASRVAVNDAGRAHTATLPSGAVTSASGTNNNGNNSTSATPQQQTNTTTSATPSTNNDQPAGAGTNANKQIAAGTPHNRYPHSALQQRARTSAALPAGSSTANTFSVGQNNKNVSASNTYKTNLSQPAPADETTEEPVAAKPTAVKTEDKHNKDKSDNKQEDKKQAGDSNGKLAKDKKQAPAPQFDRFEAGLKIGFERGFDNDGGKKAVLSPYLQFNISPRFAIMTQPALKYASLDQTRVGNVKSYYRENNDSTVSQLGPSTLVVVVAEDSLFRTDFRYKQSHDSIVKVNMFGGSYTELEIPLLLKYQLSKQLSVYGGINVVYSKTIAIAEHTYTYKSIGKYIDTFTLRPYVNPSAPYTTSSIITYPGTDISQYTGPAYPTKTTEEWRVGYMLGFSYQFYKRWLFDALIQQANARQNVQGGFDVNRSLSVPYFRLTLGYKITK